MGRRRSQRNAFQARPEEFYGGVTRGVATHPGFHTACEMEIAQPYAQMKVQDHLPSHEEGLDEPMPDYPVIVELDMQGLPYQIDYDAVEWFKDAVDAALENNDDFDDFERDVDFTDQELETPDEMIPALFHLSGQSQGMVLARLCDWLEGQEDPDEAFQRMKREGIPDELLAKIACQFRYTEDVSPDRIIAVHYVRPVFDDVFPHYDDPEWKEQDCERVIEKIKDAGYDVVTKEHIYDDREVLTTTETTRLKKPPANARIEYHGTSLRNLVSASPELADVLPLPPYPFSAEAFDMKLVTRRRRQKNINDGTWDIGDPDMHSNPAKSKEAAIRREFLKQPVVAWDADYLYHGTPVSGLVGMLKHGFGTGTHDLNYPLLSTSANAEMMDYFSKNDPRTGFIFAPAFKRVLVMDDFWYYALYGMADLIDGWYDHIEAHPEDEERAKALGLWDGEDFAYSAESFLKKFLPKNIQAIIFPGFEDRALNAEREMAVTETGFPTLKRSIAFVFAYDKEFDTVAGAKKFLKEMGDWDWKWEEE